jgi:hypothetical protein
MTKQNFDSFEQWSEYEYFRYLETGRPWTYETPYPVGDYLAWACTSGFPFTFNDAFHWSAVVNGL